MGCLWDPTIPSSAVPQQVELEANAVVLGEAMGTCRPWVRLRGHALTRSGQVHSGVCLEVALARAVDLSVVDPPLDAWVGNLITMNSCLPEER